MFSLIFFYITITSPVLELPYYAEKLPGVVSWHDEGCSAWPYCVSLCVVNDKLRDVERHNKMALYILVRELFSLTKTILPWD